MTSAPPSVLVPKRTVQGNAPSKLLSQEENETLFKLLGSRCQTQVSAVVQVFGTEDPSHSTWHKLYCGVATFTKDSNRRSYFIQVYDIVKGQKVFEQEIYNQFTYHVSVPFFHQFEGENLMIGLNFADNQEAESFNKIIMERLASKQKKKEERRRQQQLHINQQQQQLQEQQNQQLQQRQQQTAVPQPYVGFNLQSQNRVKAKRPRRANKLSKDQIGEPMNFKHVTHVGFDQDKGLSINNNHDADLNEFFKMAGVSENLLRDDNTRKFIYDFIDQHGGIERAAQETKVYGSIKRTPSSNSSDAKPALPSRNNTSYVPPPQPPPRPQQPHPQSAPPPPPPPPPKDRMPERGTAPPPPQAPLPPPPTIKPASSSHGAPPPPPPPRIPPGVGGYAPPPKAPVAGDVAPPPPPPPPPPVIGQPALPAMPVNSLQDGKARNDLLAQIRQRPTLNPVSQKKIEKPEQDSRTTLMSEIRNKEYELKPVTPIEGDANPGFTVNAENTMAAMLARALEGRAKAIQDESESEDDDDEDEDEWDEN